MINENEQTAQNFEEKVRRLMSVYQSIADENTSLKKEIENSRNNLKTAHHDYVVLQNEFNQFRIATSLNGVSDAERAESKQELLKLVREIDKCLNLLND
jgi:hypothetical protein